MTSTNNDSSTTPFKFAYKPSSTIAGLPKLPPSDLYSPIVQLQLGADLTRDLRAHENVLCRLPFFKAALQGPFTESSTKIVKMPEDDPEMVQVLVEFLYGADYKDLSTARATTPTHLIDEQITLSPVEVKIWQKVFHARVYLLAEKYDCQGLCGLALKKNKDLEIILDKSTVGLFVEYMLMVYEITTAGSRLRLTGKKDSLVNHNSRECARFLGTMWKTEDGRRHLDAAFARCPDLAVDILRLTAVAAAGLASSGGTKLARNTSSWHQVYTDNYGNPQSILQCQKNPYVDEDGMVF